MANAEMAEFNADDDVVVDQMLTIDEANKGQVFVISVAYGRFSEPSVKSVFMEFCVELYTCSH